MPVGLLEITASLRGLLGGFEPGGFSADDCARLVEDLALTEKACAAVRVLAAARAVEAKVFRERGFKDGPSWFAHHSGTSGRDARRALQTAKALDGCSETKAALLRGEVSLTEAAEITQTQGETPGCELELLEVARRGDLSQLRERARELRQASTDSKTLHDLQRRARSFRHWRDRLGMVRFAGALPPEGGLPLVRRVETEALRSRRAARAAGGCEPEPFEAYAADALSRLLGGSDQHCGRRSVRAELVIVCDIFAWRRGHAHPGEVCHIIDGGPIPVEVAKELSQDAFLKAVLHDGTNIHTVNHFGRHFPAVLRTALDLGPVPAFSGGRCVDCGSRWGLEYDHVDPVANHGPTSYHNLKPRCRQDHHHKTDQDRKAGLLTPNPP